MSDDGTINLDDFLLELSARLVSDVAQPQPEQAIERVQVMIFALGETLYAVELSNVLEVVREPAITRVPGLPSWIRGVTNLHNEIISVVALGPFLGVTAQPTLDTMIVMHAADQTIGMLVDHFEVIYTLAAADIRSPLFDVEAALVPYLAGVLDWNERLVRLLDCAQLLLSPKMQQPAS